MWPAYRPVIDSFDYFDNQNAEWSTLDFRIDETIALPTVLMDHEQLMDQLPSVSPFSKTDMGAVQPLCPLTMDDIFSPLYDAESDLAVDPTLESDLQDFNFPNNEENTLYPIDFTLLEETQAVSNACSLMIEESHLHSSQSFKFDLYEDYPVNLDDVIQLFPNPSNILTPPPSNQQAGDVPTGSKGKELSLELKAAASTSSGAPSTPELIRTILHLESTGDQFVTAKSSQPIASTLSTINAEALCGGEQILFSQSPASSSPSSPSPSTSSSVSGVSYEPSLSRPGTSCSYVSPASPAPSVVQESRASKRRGDDLLSSHLETKKLKNNEASRKSRLKRKERQYNQVEHIKQLEQNNRQLTQKVAELERLRDLLRSYSSKVTFMVTTVK